MSMTRKQWLAYDPDHNASRSEAGRPESARRQPSAAACRRARQIAWFLFGCFALASALLLKSCAEAEDAREFREMQISKYHELIPYEHQPYEPIVQLHPNEK
jgi:hypothetical protein